LINIIDYLRIILTIAIDYSEKRDITKNSTEQISTPRAIPRRSPMEKYKEYYFSFAKGIKGGASSLCL
jgi:hypothetical protein